MGTGRSTGSGTSSGSSSGGIVLILVVVGRSLVFDKIEIHYKFVVFLPLFVLQLFKLAGPLFLYMRTNRRV